MTINREWHQKHKMPPHATLAQRIDWHIQHSKVCHCREMPESINEAIRKQGRSVNHKKKIESQGAR
jgi:hypothetical protein